jgi:photosystem II stability/assembly factor-like uncharacterized protein
VVFGVGDRGNVLDATDDGGSTWVSHRIAGLDGITALRCPSASRCYAVGFIASSASAPATQAGLLVLRVLRSDDRGKTWRTLRDLPPGDAAATLACPDVSRCVILGTTESFGSGRATSTSTVFTLRGGGKAWTERPAPAIGSGFPRWLSCADADHCSFVVIASAGDRLVSTSDGGATWKSLLLG